MKIPDKTPTLSVVRSLTWKPLTVTKSLPEELESRRKGTEKDSMPPAGCSSSRKVVTGTQAGREPPTEKRRLQDRVVGQTPGLRTGQLPDKKFSAGAAGIEVPLPKKPWLPGTRLTAIATPGSAQAPGMVSSAKVDHGEKPTLRKSPSQAETTSETPASQPG